MPCKMKLPETFYAATTISSWSRHISPEESSSPAREALLTCSTNPSGTVCAVVTLPFDVVKTHRQIDLGEKELLMQEVKTKVSWKQTSTFEILKKIHKERGIPGLFSGSTPRVVKVAPACAIMISTYEYGKTFFKTYNASGRTFLEFLLDKP